MNKPKQLTFPWSKPNKSSLDEFYFDEANHELKKILNTDDDTFLYGIKKTGKTYLLQALCNKYADIDKMSLYLPLAEASQLDAKILDGVEHMDIICVDDIDLIEGFKNWETAIFNLINNCQTSGCRLIYGYSKNSSTINFSLNDLKSRVRKIDQIEVFPISDSNLSSAFEEISKHRSIIIGDKELNYLLTYTERSISSLTNILNKLDELSIQQKRKITIPLIKEII